MIHEFPPPPPPQQNQSGIQGIQSGEINWDAAARDSSAQDAYEKGIMLPEDL